MKSIKTKINDIISKVMIAFINIGVIMATSHGVYALAATDYYQDHAVFSTKVQTDQHTHIETANTFKALSDHHYVDPKSLRKIRSEGDKMGERDRDLNGWDVYTM